MKRPQNVILADDDDDDRILFEEAVEAFDPAIKITFVEDGEELMKSLSDGSKLPDLIFLDLNMPLKNGHECLEEIRSNKKLSNIPVVIYSTSSSKEHIEKTYRDGANLYIRKPNSFKELKAIAQKVFNLNWDEYLPTAMKENFFLKL